MGFRHSGYIKVPCPYCGKLIAYNNMEGKHYPKCEKAIAAKEAERLERIKNIYAKYLTFNEAQEAGRLNEWAEILKNAKSED